jgi:hypothetical protein
MRRQRWQNRRLCAGIWVTHSKAVPSQFAARHRLYIEGHVDLAKR